MGFLAKIRSYIRISGVGSISRRYFVMNAFDGATTVLGLVVGAHVAEITNPLWIISAGLGAALAMGLSGFVGAYMTEEAERTVSLKDLEKSMLSDLSNSVVGEASRFASIWTGLVDGVSPAVSAILCLLPFILSLYGMFPIHLAIQLSVGVGLFLMFLLGAFLGRISDRNVILHGVKTLCVGLVLTFVLLIFKLVK
jgi:predicted membrane protein (TIGR00267 family)